MRAALSIVLLCAIVFSGIQTFAQESGDGARFPPIEAENLEGRVYDLPGDFEGEYNVLVVAYQREQQGAVDTWFPHLETLEKSDPRLHFYELPVISRMTGLFMGWVIDRGMRRGIPEQAKRERVITIYIDKDRFKASLGLPEDEDKIRVLLVDRDGRIHWRGEGVYSDAQGDSLRTTLKGLP